MPDDTSSWDDLVAGLSQKQAPPPPPPPQPPPVNQGAWEKSVEQISDYLGRVHDLGLMVFETQSYSDRPDSNEPLDTAREKMAHVIMNGAQKWGSSRMRNAKTASPIEPTQQALGNPTVRAAYESSMKAAREAYLSRTDPTNSAVFSIQNPTPNRANYVFQGGGPDGVSISTQSGPTTTPFQTDECLRTLRGLIAISISKTTASRSVLPVCRSELLKEDSFC
jgi:hypothetical protein